MLKEREIKSPASLNLDNGYTSLETSIPFSFFESSSLENFGIDYI